MGEFELIRHYFQPVAEATSHPAMLLGPGDDCAIQRVAPSSDLVFSVDTLVEGVHFPKGYSAQFLGWRALAVAASDLAAMGADPVCFTLALTLPEANQDWLLGFAQGLQAAASEFGLALAGGDTTRGPLTVTIQVHGTVPENEAIKRSGASDGDLICVSGTLGAAGAALDYLEAVAPTVDEASVLERYHHPEPRLALGKALRPWVSAGIDISDGLVADLGHLLAASELGGTLLGGTLNASALPILESLQRLRTDATRLALYAGDDYELCVTVSPSSFAAMPESLRQSLTVVGAVHPGDHVSVSGFDDGDREASVGYDHFGSQ